MSEPDRALATMIANLEKNTGHDLDWWVGVATGSGKEKHGEVVAFLKSEHGLGHGYANLVAITVRDRAAGDRSSSPSSNRPPRHASTSGSI